MLEPITSELPKMKIDVEDPGPERPVKMPRFGTTHYFPNVGIRTENAVVAFEEFEDGDTISFVTSRNVVCISMKGKAELTYSLQATHYTEEKKMTVEAGEAYVIPKHTFVEWKVVPGSRYRHLSIMIN